MGSTDFNAPPRKLTLTAIGAVVGLHVLAALALTMVKTPAPVAKVIETPPPIEIQMVTLPADVTEPEPIAQEVIAVKAVTKPAPTPKPAVKPEPVKKGPPPKPAAVPDLKPKLKPKPQAVKESQPVAKTKPPVKSAPKKTMPQPKTQPDTAKVVKNEPFRHYVQPQESASTAQADALAATEERKVLAAQAEKAAQETHAKAMRDAQAAADAKAAQKAEEDAKAIADAKAARDVKAAADAKAAQAAANAKAEAEAASNTPVNFNASNANWAAQPNFSFPSRAARRANSGDIFNLVLILRVNKQGGIDSVRVAQSSGNAVLDKEAQRQVRSGKFRPFKKNGMPVVGNVTLPISYAVP